LTDTPNLLTVGQAAQPLGVGVLTIRSWVRGDRCPVVRDGRAGADTGGLGG
jgi:excisionase family DNA binding protein